MHTSDSIIMLGCGSLIQLNTQIYLSLYVQIFYTLKMAECLVLCPIFVVYLAHALTE